MQDQTNAGANPTSASILDKDGKLSSASAATSLKYAKARDLPSFPSTGGVQMSSAGAAASLANSNKKAFEHWKPEPIPAANKAAMLAKDHKMDPLWHPEASAAGSKAAMMAAAHPTHVEPIQLRTSAANKSAAPSAAYDTPENTHSKALMAANAASHNRRRSGSLPMQAAVKPNDSTSWAMKAATKSHKDGPPPSGASFTTGDPGFEAARIQNVAKNNVNRQMYTASPPVSIEVQEKNRQDTLRASAVAMAQKMYAIQQKQIDEAAGKSDGHALAASRARSSTVTGSTGTVSEGRPTPGAGYENLEEAARKLAQERLAKIHDEHAEYRSYYGQTSPPPRSRLSMRLSRRRASSVADDDDSDEEQSRKIRSQMSIFQSKVAEVDTKKRQQDRDNLLQIAHRNVDAQISKMDDRLFQDTGKATPAQMEKWEKSAREKAQADSDHRMQHMGKVHIGGGKYLDQSELDAIARARLQPTLDEISEKAEKLRARDEEERLDRERKLAQAAKEKARAAETAALLKSENERVKQEERAQRETEKARRAEEKQTERTRKDEEKRLRREEEEKRKSGRLSKLLGRGGVANSAGAPGADADAPGAKITTQAQEDPTATSETVKAVDSAGEEHTFHDMVTTEPSTSSTNTAATAVPVASPSLDTHLVSETVAGGRSVEPKSSLDEKNDTTISPTKSKVKSWMNVRFRSKSNAQKDSSILPAMTEAKAENKDKATGPVDSVPRTDSMRDVAMAGRTSTGETDDLYTANKEVSPERIAPRDTVRDRSPSISSLSSESSDKHERGISTDSALGTTEQPETDTEQRGRSGFGQRLMDMIMPSKEKAKDETVVPVVTNTTDDEFEEARDTFEEEKLSPPPALSTLTGEGSKPKPLSPSRGSRERSRFTEEL